MYAIVEIAGKQFRVKEKGRLRVPLLPVESGKKVEFENVLVLNDDKGKLTIGTPTVSKVKVSATVIEHNREKKIVVFKKKRRKGYQVKNGHRQHYSLIEVNKIGVSAGKTETKVKVEETKPVATVKAEAKPKAVKPKPKTAATKTETTVKPKTTAKPKTAAKPKPETKTAKPKTAAKPKAKPKEDKKEA